MSVTDAELDAIEARANDNVWVSAAEDVPKLVAELREARRLLSECHNQYGMPIGTNERIEAFLGGVRK